MNFFTEDRTFCAMLKRMMDPELFNWAEGELSDLGSAAAGRIDERAAHTDNAGAPKLVKYDRFGEDQSYVWVNEGYRQTADDIYRRGIVAYPHREILELGRKGNYFYSFAQGYLLSQAEPGFYCPVTLTMATAYLLDSYGDDELKRRFLPHILSTGEKEIYEGGTFLTERQGGSDVGANETEALEAEDGSYRLYGEKYFASNAGRAEVAMVLARIAGSKPGTKGLSLFLVPWHHEDGTRNRLSIRRLKDKLGVKAVPSAEVELDGAKGYLVGTAEKGFYYMMEALNLSRISNAVASLGIMRRSYLESYTYAETRQAFAKPLIDYPMIQDTLTKMKIKLDAELYSVFHLIEEYDLSFYYERKTSDSETAYLRLLIALIKAETADQSISFAHEAIEMHGGNGYIEDFVTPRLLRDAQVLTVWEGTSNILGLEVLRLMNKYAINQEFIRRMEEKAARCYETDPKLLANVRSMIAQLADELDEITALSDYEQTRKIKPAAKKMVTIFETVMMLEATEEADPGSWEQISASIYIKSQLYPLFSYNHTSWRPEEGWVVLGLTEQGANSRV
ncbi:acyl-CoA dehydrogenase family protein [Salisediminibacterium halotolerans]|uniref:Acyl-CoA dehydrogenase n=1 Tax=Salisediminibacterium halotolerans TaxID=517425 RepID=A0A1H9UB64_9BACI|nr:acyl-CoA dehydrogenase family protein [Salisediminibacterium haloalkalitolerans]SES06333.1 Acyl-CoA dehydrogenase [Salisediminibacterium haloalkalitolerans]